MPELLYRALFPPIGHSIVFSFFPESARLLTTTYLQGVKHLRLVLLQLLDSVGHFKHAVGQSRFAVVDMGDDGKVPDALPGHRIQ